MTTIEFNPPVVTALLAILTVIGGAIIKSFRTGKALQKMEGELAQTTADLKRANEAIGKLQVDVTSLREAHVRESAKSAAQDERLGRMEDRIEAIYNLLSSNAPPPPRRRRSSGAAA